MSFHNTIDLGGKKLRKSQKQSQSQETVVLTALGMSKIPYTPSQLWKKLLLLGTIAKHTPLTSIRRALSDLVYDGQIAKIEEMQQGIYGMPEHFWASLQVAKKLENKRLKKLAAAKTEKPSPKQKAKAVKPKSKKKKKPVITIKESKARTGKKFPKVKPKKSQVVMQDVAPEIRIPKVKVVTRKKKPSVYYPLGNRGTGNG